MLLNRIGAFLAPLPSLTDAYELELHKTTHRFSSQVFFEWQRPGKDSIMLTDETWRGLTEQAGFAAQRLREFGVPSRLWAKFEE